MVTQRTAFSSRFLIAVQKYGWQSSPYWLHFKQTAVFVKEDCVQQRIKPVLRKTKQPPITPCELASFKTESPGVCLLQFLKTTRERHHITTAITKRQFVKQFKVKSNRWYASRARADWEKQTFWVPYNKTKQVPYLTSVRHHHRHPLKQQLQLNIRPPSSHSSIRWTLEFTECAKQRAYDCHLAYLPPRRKRIKNTRLAADSGQGGRAACYSAVRWNSGRGAGVEEETAHTAGIIHFTAWDEVYRGRIRFSGTPYVTTGGCQYLALDDWKGRQSADREKYLLVPSNPVSSLPERAWLHPSLRSQTR